MVEQPHKVMVALREMSRGAAPYGGDAGAVGRTRADTSPYESTDQRRPDERDRESYPPLREGLGDMSVQLDSRVMRVVRQFEADEAAEPRMNYAERRAKFIALRQEMFAWEAASSINPLPAFGEEPTGEFDIAGMREHDKKIAAWRPFRGRAAA